LNNELVQVKKELKEANQFKEKAQREPPMGAQLIDNTLQTITNIQQQKKDLLNQNESLNKRVLMLEQIYSQGFDEKQRYMEGAIWMGHRLQSEIKGMLIAIEYLAEELAQRWQQILRREEKSGESSWDPHVNYVLGDKGSGFSSPDRQIFWVEQMDVKKLLEWFQRASTRAGDELNAKTKDVISSA
jgi:hypothetical protein